MTQEEKIELLNECAPLMDASASTLDQLATALESTFCTAGTSLIQQGKTSQTLYIVVQGEFEVTVGKKGAQPEIISLLKRGSIFGEIGVVSGIPAKFIQI